MYKHIIVLDNNNTNHVSKKGLVGCLQIKIYIFSVLVHTLDFYITIVF